MIGAAFLDETCKLKMLYATHLGPYPMVDGLCLFGHQGEKTVSHRTIMIKNEEDDQVIFADVVVPISYNMVADYSSFPFSIGSLIRNRSRHELAFELNGDSSYLASVPIMLPLLPHHNLVEGPITSERV